MHPMIKEMATGGLSNNNPGNKSYLKIIEGKKGDCKAIEGNTKNQRKLRKTQFMRRIVKKFKDDGYMFVRKQKDEKRTRDKISKALREKEKKMYLTRMYTWGPFLLPFDLCRGHETTQYINTYFNFKILIF